MPQRRRRSDCPIHFALETFGDRWTLLVLRDLLLKGRSSYSEFLRAEERIATNILADRLRRMEEAGLIRRTAPEPGSARGAYALTPRGAALLPVLQELARWGEAQLPDRWPAPDRFYAARPEDLAGPRR
jgi:DNA-binding HxlR family transcriptional regulator